METSSLTLILDGSATDVSHARAFVRQHLPDCSAERADDAVLVASELVTNAVVHAGGPVHLRLSTSGSGVSLRVLDLSSQRPQPRQAAPDATDGRGLALVAAVADRWGVEEHASGGKSVWAELGSLPTSSAIKTTAAQELPHNPWTRRTSWRDVASTTRASA